jgi:hypothetical protein
MGAFTEYQAAEERLKALADVSSALAGQIAELLELRELVQQAQLSAECKKEPPKKRAVRPGRLFTQNHLIMGGSYRPARTSSQF